MANIQSDSETRYSITLSGLTREAMLRVMREKSAGTQTLKEIKAEMARLLAMRPQEIPSHTIARPPISHKAECPRCHDMFEARGLGVHLYRKHGIRVPVRQIAPPDGRLSLPAGNAADLVECPICHATHGKLGRPFDSRNIRRHLAHAHHISDTAAALAQPVVQAG